MGSEIKQECLSSAAEGKSREHLEQHLQVQSLVGEAVAGSVSNQHLRTSSTQHLSRGCFYSETAEVLQDAEMCDDLTQDLAKPCIAPTQACRDLHAHPLLSRISCANDEQCLSPDTKHHVHRDARTTIATICFSAH